MLEEQIKYYLHEQIRESLGDKEFYNVKIVVEKVSEKSSRELFATVLEIKDNKRSAIERYSTLVRQFFTNNGRPPISKIER